VTNYFSGWNESFILVMIRSTIFDSTDALADVSLGGGNLFFN